MEAWTWWLVLAGVVVICELFTGTFYLLMFALGLVSASIASLLTGSVQLQMLVAAIVGSAATIALHNSRYGWKQRGEATRDPNVNIDIGQQLRVDEWQEQGNGVSVARTKYRGAMWDVELRHAQPNAGLFVIEAVEGSRLVVRPT
ncbi:NfeD family protein [Undibacterium fentianense]|uniref:NfeD family protein n=1 Tax=Undibacterium fentianense TaxID=2828728 RepID=A0A941DXD9_9BURK|nr:NfeD family protein [Undibacterium fentianense]MBR7798475.1 NfeD family protein [Undibacterium fentianense]